MEVKALNKTELRVLLSCCQGKTQAETARRINRSRSLVSHIINKHLLDHFLEVKSGKNYKIIYKPIMCKVCGKILIFPGVPKKKCCSEKCKNEDLRIARQGEKNPNWNGGTSFAPYCEKFNKEFRERVRAFFDYKCVECGSPENSRRHAVHHVNYDKMVCCNDVKPTFILLCNPCNLKANGKREYWEQHFTEMIEGYYGGKCYFTKEEMKVWQI